MKRKTAAAVIAAIISTWAVRLHLGIHKSEFLILLLVTGAFFLFKTVFSLTDRKTRKVSLILGGLFSLFYLLYDLSKIYGEYRFAYKLAVCFIGCWLLFSAFLELGYTYFKDKSLPVNSAEKTAALGGRGKAIVFSASFLIIYGWFLFWLLAQFPGNMSTDSYNQLMQAVGLMPLSNNHPTLHTLLIRLCYNTGLKLFNGNQNNAMGFYCAVQSFLMAGCFAYFFETLYAFGLKIKHLLLVLLAFFITAFHGIYSVTVWKDVLFGGWTLLLSCSLWCIIAANRENPGKVPVFDTVVFFAAALLFCLFRKNGYYAFLACLPFLFVVFVKKSPVIPIFSVVIAVLIYIINGPFFARIGISSSDTIEFLSVPFQHIICAVKDGAELSEEEYTLLSEIVDVPKAVRTFSPSHTNGLKELVREKDNQKFLDANLKEYLKLWIRLACRHPMSYLKAQIELTKGYWYPAGTQWTIYVAVKEDTEYSKYFEIHSDSKFSDSFYNWLQNLWIDANRLPLFALSSSMGTGLFVTLILFGMCSIKKKKYLMIVYAPVITIMATLLIAPPLDAEFRYAYPMFTTLPLLCVIPFFPTEKRLEINNGQNSCTCSVLQ